jgi:hypothetical protein
MPQDPMNKCIYHVCLLLMQYTKNMPDNTIVLVVDAFDVIFKRITSISLKPTRDWVQRTLFSLLKVIAGLPGYWRLREPRATKSQCFPTMPPVS